MSLRNHVHAGNRLSGAAVTYIRSSHVEVVILGKSPTKSIVDEHRPTLPYNEPTIVLDSSHPNDPITTRSPPTTKELHEVLNLRQRWLYDASSLHIPRRATTIPFMQTLTPTTHNVNAIRPRRGLPLESRHPAIPRRHHPRDRASEHTWTQAIVRRPSTRTVRRILHHSGRSHEVTKSTLTSTNRMLTKKIKTRATQFLPPPGLTNHAPNVRF